MTLNLLLLISPLFEFATRLVFGRAHVYACAQTFAAAIAISPLTTTGNAVARMGYSSNPVTINAGLNPVNAGEHALVNSSKPFFKQMNLFTTYIIYYTPITHNL